MEGRLLFDGVDLKRSRLCIDDAVESPFDVLPIPAEASFPFRNLTSPETEMTLDLAL
jgi:hypothetical protein